jgi:peptidyl-prolyl cis-trans isomerase A (cyclophilin A)
VRRFAPSLILCPLLFLAPADLFAQGQTQSTAAKPAATAQSRTKQMTTDPALLHPASLTAKAPDVYDVTFVTTKGDFVVQVTRSWAPIGADRFYNLVKHGFYNGAGFFRIVPGFVVQFGLGADPAVNKAMKDANIKDDPVTQSNKLGYLTFATAGPNTRTTQVFISLGNNARLDSMGFAAFGQVTSGMDVVQGLYSGYGESPDQGKITNEGKAYIDKNFPKLDTIKTATVTSPAASSSGATKPAAKP